MEWIIVQFHEDGTVSEGFENLVCLKCGQSLELYEFHNGKYIIVCSHSAENPEPFEAGYTSFEVSPGKYKMNQHGEIQHE